MIDPTRTALEQPTISRHADPAGVEIRILSIPFQRHLLIGRRTRIYAARANSATRSHVVAFMLARFFIRASQTTRLGWAPVSKLHSGVSEKKSIWGANMRSARVN